MANTVKISNVCPAIYGISVRRYQQLAKEGLVPPSVGGFIDFLVATKALISYYQKLVQGTGSITLVEERARLTKVQADLSTLAYEKELGNLLEKNQVIHIWSAMIQASRSRFLSIPVKTAPLLEGLTKQEIKKILEDVIYDALNELASMELGDGVVEREAKNEPQAIKKEQVVADHKVKKIKERKRCAVCNRKIDKRATLCKRCASKQREKNKKQNVNTKK